MGLGLVLMLGFAFPLELHLVPKLGSKLKLKLDLGFKIHTGEPWKKNVA